PLPMRREPVSGSEAVRAGCTGRFAKPDARTLVPVRLDRTGVVAGAIYLVLGVLWAMAADMPVALAWFVAVAVVGAFIPGPANQVSLARAYLAAPALAYALRQDFGSVALVVAIAGLTDLVDGTIARRIARPSTLGGGLDPVVDGVLTGALAIGLAMGGTFPLWLALVVIARYLLPALAGAVLRSRPGRAVHGVPCSAGGRAKRARSFFLDPAGWFKVSPAGRVVALSGRGASF